MTKSNDSKIELANRLVIARQNAGLTQDQVSKLLGLQRPTISEIEASRRNVTADELKRFSEIYDVSIEWLLGTTSTQEVFDDDRIELAARELAKLKQNDLDKVMNLLSALRKGAKE